MRQNLPINNKEVRVRSDQYLISKTDLKGRIIYANPAFIEISGFSPDELRGKAHNIVRHPDMPPAAFADLWQTVQAGKSWLGIVKNRRKDGGFYWVQAFVAPIIEDGTVTGYSSIRVRPTDEQIRQASQAYEKINTNTLHGYTVKEGQIVKTGWRRWLEAFKIPFLSTPQAKTIRLLTLGSLTTLIASYFATHGGLSDQQLPWFYTLIITALLATYLYGWHLLRGINRPMQQATHIAQQIAAGNLIIDTDNSVSNQSNNDLLFVLSIMRKGLSAIADDTHIGIEASLQAADRINQSNQLLADRTRNQADSLQQTAASMEELTTTVQQNADNTREATELAEHSMGTAQQGGKEVQALIDSMQGIAQSSRQITDIVNLIDSIAFQTNILALNAAVESARAGESGRGFAVVAGEVRSLAQRSAQAANDIKKLIDESVQRIDNGAQQAESAGNTMKDVVKAVSHVNQIINDIALASSEQAIGLHQIHQAITQIDDVTQQNTDLVDDLGNTMELLATHAQTLDQAIRVLNTEKTPKRRPAPAEKQLSYSES